MEDYTFYCESNINKEESTANKPSFDFYSQIIKIDNEILTVEGIHDHELEKYENSRKASTANEPHEPISFSQDFGENHNDAAEELASVVVDHERTATEDAEPELLTNENFKYFGGVHRGQRDGFGVCHYTNGAIYRGYFKRNKREGYGQFTSSTANQVISGEFVNNILNGFTEKIDKVKDYSVIGCAFGTTFIENTSIIIKKNKLIYETITEYINTDTLSASCIGKLIHSSHKFFLGITHDFQEQKGMFYKKDNWIYFGEINANNEYDGYGEYFGKNGARHFGTYRLNRRDGWFVSVLPDNKFVLSRFIKDVKHGPVFIVSKNAWRLELYLNGFKVKCVDKKPNIDKYLMLNYPEFSNTLKINVSKLIQIFSDAGKDDDYVREMLSPPKEETIATATATVANNETKN